MSKYQEDDARDYINTGFYLLRLSNRALEEIPSLKRSVIKQRLKEGSWPFDRMSRKYRRVLVYLPTTWTIRAAEHLLEDRTTGSSAKVQTRTRKRLKEYRSRHPVNVLCACADRSAHTTADFYCEKCDEFICHYCQESCKRYKHKTHKLKKPA